MRFAFTEDQLALRDAVRDLLTKECPPAAVRAAWTSDTGRVPDAWRALADMGVLGVLAPESAGGLGLSEVDLVLVLEETGYAALPEPVVETAAVAVPLLATTGDARVERLVTGEESATVTSAEAPHGLWADTASVHVHLAADGARVGTLPRPPVLVADHDGIRADRDVPVLSRVASVDGARRLHAIRWVTGDVDHHGAIVLSAAPPEPVGDLAAAGHGFDRAALGTAAQLVGLARRMLDTTVAYAAERHQFGVPIGSFQAVKHHLADVRVALEFATPLVHRAAWSLAHDPHEATLPVAMAKAKASEVALLAARVALQCHGAIGYSTEADLHLWMKRAWALARTWGDAAWHRARIGRAIL